MTPEERIISELRTLGLRQQEAEKAVKQRRGVIDAYLVQQDLDETDIANLIWSELVNPFQDIEV